MKHRSRLFLCLLASMTVQGYSQEPGAPDSNDVADAESRYLFINMLEFLGEFETDDGEWVSPDILGNDVFSDLDAGDNNAGNLNTGGGRQVFSAGGGDSSNNSPDNSLDEE